VTHVVDCRVPVDKKPPAEAGGLRARPPTHATPMCSGGPATALGPTDTTAKVVFIDIAARRHHGSRDTDG
jgi:hypothetical protein